jgi:site-specific DNA-methyltransferase (adenine-specific)
MSKEVKINPEYLALVPRPNNEDYVALETSIIKHGRAIVPIEVNSKDEILDGHTRFEICTKHNLPFEKTIRYFDSILDEKIYVIEINLHRRHLIDYQKIEISEPLERLIAEKARQRQLLGVTLASFEAKGKTTELTAKAIGVSKATYERGKKVRDEGTEEEQKTARAKSHAINTAYQKLIKRKKSEEKQEIKSKLPNRLNIKILQGNLTDVALKLDENSIDFIITDPPYGEKYLNLYTDLGAVAKKLLKPNGSLIVLTGQSYLPEIMKRLEDFLKYNWVVAYLTPGGQSVQLWQRKVNTFWKPVLWFVKEDYTGKWLGDVVKSDVNANEKQFMEWQQSESGMLDLINRFTEQGDTILDPFMGSGTTGVAAIQLDRNFIGIDIDPEKITIAKKRLGIIS